jgi:hypothetical protein
MEDEEYFWVYICDDWIDGWIPVPKKDKESEK